MKLRVALCASALVLALPAVASAAIGLTPIPLPTKVPVLQWDAGDAAGPYSVFRDDGACPAPPNAPSAPAIASGIVPTSFPDSPSDGPYCYWVDDDLSPNLSNGIDVTVDNVGPPAPNITAPAASSVLHDTVNVTGSFSNDAVSGTPTKLIELVPSSGPGTSIGTSFPVSLDTSPFADGTYSIVAHATDAALNES